MIDKLVKALDSIPIGYSFADVRMEFTKGTSVTVSNGVVDQIARGGGRRGVIFRVLYGGAWGYSSTTELSEENLRASAVKAFEHARAASIVAGSKVQLSEEKVLSLTRKQRVSVDGNEVDVGVIVADTSVLEKAARQFSKLIKNANASTSYGYKHVIYLNSEGSRMEWDEVRTSMSVGVVAASEGRMQSWYEARSGFKDYSMFNNVNVEALGTRCAENCVEMLDAVKAPTGSFDVVLNDEMGGLLAHECFGHACEGDDVVKGRSFLKGLLNKRIGSECVTIVDDGSYAGCNGYIPFDSEGVESKRNVLVDRGILVSYMHSRETAGAMGVSSTGNARAQDFTRRVYVRMTNTFFDKGDSTLEELTADVKYGVYAVKPSQGMEDPVGGSFHVEAYGGWLIENGETTKRIRNFTLSGHTLEILKRVDGCSRALEVDSGGRCGKGDEDDYVPVSLGGPDLRVRGMIVGGG